MREPVRVGARALLAPVVLLLATAASADSPDGAAPGTAWRDEFPFADEIDARAFVGVGAGVRVRHWARSLYPGIGDSAEAYGGGAGVRALHLVDLPGMEPLRTGLSGEIVGVTTHGRTHDSICLGACAHSAGIDPGSYRFESDQCWVLGGGALRLSTPTRRVHLQLDGGAGVAWLRTESRLGWGPVPPGPGPPVERRGESDAMLAAGRIGLELGLRLTRRGAVPVGTRFHLGLRLRLDVWSTVGRARLRLDGDPHASAGLSPTFVSLSLGMTAVF